MSIRNKRLLIEKDRMDYKINLPDDLTQEDIIVTYRNEYNIDLFIKINNKYPFQYPKMYQIQNQNIEIDYIQSIMNKRTENKYKNLINKFKLNIPCICCDTITCRWTPSYGIKEMIEEFEKYNSYFYMLEKFEMIYKIKRFDDLIYSNIIHFLYLHNI